MKDTAAGLRVSSFCLRGPRGCCFLQFEPLHAPEQCRSFLGRYDSWEGFQTPSDGGAGDPRHRWGSSLGLGLGLRAQAGELQSGVEASSSVSQGLVG